MDCGFEILHPPSQILDILDILDTLDTLGILGTLGVLYLRVGIAHGLGLTRLC